MNTAERTLICNDDNIAEIRSRYPNGLHFVVGDTHGECNTLYALMRKIEFDPSIDHVYFLGDYNAGLNVGSLLSYIAKHYQDDHTLPGFHIIRGNHERELCPQYYLENHPDIMVVRGREMVYYLAHAGMVSAAFEVINKDMASRPGENVFAYKLDDCSVAYDAPLRQIIWSRNGLYSQTSHWHVWPSEVDLYKNKACIIHGHSPYCFFKHEKRFSYGENNLFWQKQHVFFCEELQSFNLDSNIKGRYENGESYRGLSCVCLEVLDEIAAANNGWLSVEGVKAAENAVFGVEYNLYHDSAPTGDINALLAAKPKMKIISLNEMELPYVHD